MNALAFPRTIAIGPFSGGALHELSLDDVDRMLGLSETLFVEHKAGIGEKESFKLLEAVAAFANTAGGWVLLGVDNGKVVASGDSVWAVPGAPLLVDIVRVRLRGKVDPLPAFEAKVFTEHPNGPLTVVRVMSRLTRRTSFFRTGRCTSARLPGSATPRIPKRSGAGALADRHYRAVKIGSRAELLELAARGRAAEERVHGLLNTAYRRGRRGGIVEHLWIRVADVAAARRFYKTIASHAPLQLRDDTADRVQFIVGTGTSFSLVSVTPTENVHIAFPAENLPVLAKSTVAVALLTGTLTFMQ